MACYNPMHYLGFKFPNKNDPLLNHSNVHDPCMNKVPGDVHVARFLATNKVLGDREGRIPAVVNLDGDRDSSGPSLNKYTTSVPATRPILGVGNHQKTLSTMVDNMTHHQGMAVEAQCAARTAPNWLPMAPDQMKGTEDNEGTARTWVQEDVPRVQENVPRVPDPNLIKPIIQKIARPESAFLNQYGQTSRNQSDCYMANSGAAVPSGNGGSTNVSAEFPAAELGQKGVQENVNSGEAEMCRNLERGQQSMDKEKRPIMPGNSSLNPLYGGGDNMANDGIFFVNKIGEVIRANVGGKDNAKLKNDRNGMRSYANVTAGKSNPIPMKLNKPTRIGDVIC